MTPNTIPKHLLTVALCVAAAGGRARPADAAEVRSFSVSASGPTTARPMILIPGLMSAGDVWAETAARYAGRYRVHVLTLSGFAGRAPMAGDAFLPTVRDQLIDYIRAEHLDHPVIVGHSLGGFLAFSAGVDFYNLLNAATPLAYNQAFIVNGAWMTPTQVMSARFAKLSLQLDF